MSGVRSYNLNNFSFFEKNNRLISCIIHENFVPLHHRYKTGKASKICGMTIEKIFHSHLGNFS